MIVEFAKQERIEITSVNGRKILVLPYEDLVERDLSGRHLEFANLRGANLFRSNISRSDLTWAKLESCNLSGTNLEGCFVIGCSFNGSDLSEATGLDRLRNDEEGNSGFYKASWKGCNFEGVDLSWVDAELIDNPAEFFSSCTGLPDGFIESLSRKKRGRSAFGM